MIILVYVNDCLFFGPDANKIEKVIAELRANKLSLMVESDDAYSFLGVEVKPNEDGGYKLNQKGLIDKVL